jgi:hypothetical protein
VYRSVIHDNDSILVRIYIAQGREETIFNKRIESIAINTARVDVTCNIAVHSHSREDTEVVSFLKLHGIGNNAPFGAPSVSPCSRTRINTRFVEENNLFRSPSGDFSKPGISKLLVSLCRFLCKLSLAQHESETDLSMCDPEFLEDNAQSTDSDCNPIPIANFFDILLQ